MSLLPVRRSTRTTSSDPLVQLQNDVNELFDRVFRGWGLYDPLELRSVLTPALDMEEDDRHYYLHMDVPGVDARDISVEVDNGLLTVSGEKREERERGSRRSRTSERYYGRFYREVSLPQDADVDQLKAELKRGVLTITLPKTKSSSRRVIQVEGE
jgi:HSP20 family protein